MFNKWRGLFGVLGGASLGGYLGASMGIAAFGTAVSGLWPLAIVFGILGWLLATRRWGSERRPAVRTENRANNPAAPSSANRRDRYEYDEHEARLLRVEDELARLKRKLRERGLDD